MDPLEIRFRMAGNQKPSQVEQQVVATLKGLCGAPDRDKILIGKFTGEVTIYWQNYLGRDIPEIKERLLSCDGVDSATLKIIETTKIYH